MSSTELSAPLSAEQVGSEFVQQYFDLFRNKRELVHRFYTDMSSTVRVDEDVCDSASGMEKIHQLIMSLNFTGMEIDTLNSIESWAGGLLVAVSGSVELRDFSGSRKFVQTFFLAPQEGGYFILNDVFHFSDERSVHQLSATSSHLDDLPVPDHPLEEAEPELDSQQKLAETEAKGPTEEAPKEDSTDLTQQEPQPESKELEEVSPREDSSTLPQDTETMHEPQPLPEKPEGPRTYASLLRATGKSPEWFRAPAAFTQPLPPAVVTTSPTVLSTVPVTVVEEALPVVEGESHCVCVKNLPYALTRLDIFEEFKNFGKIKDDGVVLKNKKNTGAYFAFVKFEDYEGVQSAIKASPLQLLGRQVYIEERGPKTSVAAHGGRREGRGRGGRGRSFGRGSEQNGDNFKSSNDGNTFGWGSKQNGSNFRSSNDGKNFGRGSKQNGDNFRRRSNVA